MYKPRLPKRFGGSKKLCKKCFKLFAEWVLEFLVSAPTLL